MKGKNKLCSFRYTNPEKIYQVPIKMRNRAKKTLAGSFNLWLKDSTWRDRSYSPKRSHHQVKKIDHKFSRKGNVIDKQCLIRVP